MRKKKQITIETKTADLKAKLEIEKNYHMEYHNDQWLLVLKDPANGEILEKRAAFHGQWRPIWKKKNA